MKKRIIALLVCVTIIFSSAAVAGAHGVSADSCGYHVTWDMMTPELRLVGTTYRLVMPRLSKGMYKIGNFILDNFGEGVNLAKNVNFEQIYIAGADGGELRLCVYSPKERRSGVPGLLWIHGGGYAIGIPEQDYKFVEDFVAASGCVVVAPDYTNSPSAPFPAALEDCYSALKWLRDNGEKYGMRSDKIFVGGDSAGGGLTAAISLYARDKKEISIAFQMPLYPMLDDRMITESSKDNDAPVWSSESNETAWQTYLGENYGTDNVSKYAAPARETDYEGLPPTLTYVGTIEPFRDETVQYVENLRAAGIPVSFKLYEGCFHAFDLFGFADVAKDAKKFLTDGFMYAAEHYLCPQP